MNKKLRCAVFGANGYIGMHISKELSARGYHVYNFDLQEESTLTNYTAFDICDAGAYNILPSNLDKIYFFAGVAGTHTGFDNPALFITVNELGLLNMLKFIISKSPSTHIIYPSTRLVYKGSSGSISEGDPKETKTIYAANKLAAENYLTIFSNYYGLEYTVYRICVPYGNLFNNGYSYGTIGFFLKQIKNTGIISLYGDGELRRTFTYIEDLCHHIIDSSLLEQSKKQVFNTDGENYSLLEISRMIAHKFHGKVQFKDWDKKDLFLESGDTVFNSDKIKSILPNTKNMTFKNWLEKLDL